VGVLKLWEPIWWACSNSWESHLVGVFKFVGAHLVGVVKLWEPIWWAC